MSCRLFDGTFFLLGILCGSNILCGLAINIDGMDELYRLIPDRYVAGLKKLSMERLSELRIRNRMPVKVCYGGAYSYLTPQGIGDIASAITASDGEAESVIMRACGRSLYTVTDTVKNGYIKAACGIRIGVCGTAVRSDGHIVAVKDFSSVNIRLPHEVIGCANAIAAVVVGKCVKSTLIISPPGAGKTTMLRDFCRTVSDRGFNVLLCDEKFEIASCVDGAPTLDVGKSTDVISGLDKKSVFEIGIASMRPDVIMADELFERDIESVLAAMHSGIAVVATVHAKDLHDLKRKRGYADLVGSGAFSRYAVISPPPERRTELFDEGGVRC